jgi:hypothetical protein
MAETNVDWRVLKETEKLPARTREWWDQQHVSWMHNRTMGLQQVRQYGGCALFSVNKQPIERLKRVLTNLIWGVGAGLSIKVKETRL